MHPAERLELIRYCVRCGARLERREAYGAVRPVCPGCRHVHFLDPKVAVAVVVEQDGRILLIQRRGDPEAGKWSIPAGFMDAGEDPRAAAEREALEETGLIVRATTLWEVFGRTDPEEGADLLLAFRAEVVGGALVPGDDAADARFFGPQELPEAIAFGSAKAILADWLRVPGRDSTG
ncbi:MAG TPA: NUDIX domain-containing protein [Anaerolineales bacterium]|nr:NUDIX domain-containing protein [Anaerolineales bacterium]HRF47195.1 NUDIX domain-containing protein [Anaerolineales bacterium]